MVGDELILWVIGHEWVFLGMRVGVEVGLFALVLLVLGALIAIVR